MEASDLFARDCEELSRLANSTDAYQLLRTAAILRRLLVDGTSLVDKVNRPIGLKLEFRGRELPEFPADIPAPTVCSLQDGVYPGFSEEGLPPKLRAPVRVLTKKQLLAHVVMTIRKRRYTVRPDWQQADPAWSEWPRLMANLLAQLVAAHTRYRRDEAAAEALEGLRHLRHEYPDAADPARLLTWSEAVIGNREGLRAYDEKNAECPVTWPDESD